MAGGGLALIDGLTGEVLDAGTRSLWLDLPEGLPFDDWRGMGERLATYERGVQWWVGDWWAFGSAKYGERAQAAAKGAFGRSFQTLMNCATVARKFETSRRREVLSYAHHAEVAALSTPDADHLLDRAESEGWNRRELRQEVSRRRVNATLPAANAESCTVKDLDVLVASGRRFGTIYADPPWLYDNQGTRAATGNHYGGMTIEELCALPVRDLALPDAHLHLWTTNGFLFECPRLFEAWGFEFRSSFIWVKPQMGIGNYWRNSHEILLTAIRGKAKRFNDHSLTSWLECGRGAHSAKPEQVRGYIRRASPGPYLEMFGRAPADGWVVWGNQIERALFDSAIGEMAA